MMRNSDVNTSNDDLKKEIKKLKLEITQLKTFQLDPLTLSQKNPTSSKHNKDIFHTIFENAGIGMAIINRNSEIVKFNKACSTLSGYTGAELYQMTYYDLIPDHNKDNAEHFIQALLSSQLTKYQGEHIYIRKDKSLVWLRITASVVYDEFGVPEYIIGLGEDITESKKQEKNRDLVNDISNAINCSDNLFSLNRAIKESLQTIIEAKHFFIALYNDSEDTFSVPSTINQKERFETFSAEKTLVGYVQKNREPVLLNFKEIIDLERKGEIFIAGKLSKQWLGVPLINEEKTIGVIGVQSFDNEIAFDNNDLTVIEILSKQISASIQKMRTESTLRIERAYFKELFDNSPEAIAIVDNSSLIININKAFTALFGYTKDEVINKLIEDLISRTDQRNESINITHEITKGKVIKTDSQRVKKDGSIVDVSIWGTPIVLDEGQIAVYAVFRDISDRVETELKLKEAKEKAEESDRLKTAFLTNMSHEIRTPMNAIIGFSELVAVPNLDAKSKKDFVQQIYNSSTMLLNLIDDIIDISQIDAGDFQIKKKKFNLTRTFNEFLSKFEKDKIQENKNGIEILLHNPFGDLIAYIETDELRFKQILQHLISNALKYTDTGFIEFGFDIDQHDKPIFYIRDTGIGIPTDKTELIFKHFTKIEDRTKLYRGTGIGLTITQKLVQLLGGKIWLESNIGIGSIFYFTLPDKIELLEINLNNYNNSAKYNWNGKKILIAEDDYSNFEVLKASLSRTHVSLIRVTQGDQAVEHCKNNSCDLVLMDIKMPGLNGISAAKQIKLLKPTLPIIAQTAYIYKNKRDTCIEAGFDEYISKPIKSVELLKTISKFID